MMISLPLIRYWPPAVIVGMADVKLVDNAKVPSTRKVHSVTEGPNWLITVSVFHLPISVLSVVARWQDKRLTSRMNRKKCRWVARMAMGRVTDASSLGPGPTETRKGGSAALIGVVWYRNGAFFGALPSARPG